CGFSALQPAAYRSSAISPPCSTASACSAWRSAYATAASTFIRGRSRRRAGERLRSDERTLRGRRARPARGYVPRHETTPRIRLRPRAARRGGAGNGAAVRSPLRSALRPPRSRILRAARRALLCVAAHAPSVSLLERPPGHVLQRRVGLLGPVERRPRLHPRPALRRRLLGTKGPADAAGLSSFRPPASRPSPGRGASVAPR